MKTKNNIIGILTLQKVINYGGALQAFALQKTIEKIGYHSEIIDLKRPYKKAIKIGNKYGYIAQQFFMLYIHIRKIGTYILNAKGYWDIRLLKLKRKRKLFEDFEAKNLIFSKEKYSSETIINCQNNYSTLIVGSDQVWNHEFVFDIESYFLEFVNTKITKVAYAPSFGVKEIPLTFHKRYASWLNKFDYLSIREEHGMQLIKKLIAKKIPIVLDPTLLLNANEWSNLLQLNTFIDYPYILCFTLSGEDDLALALCKKIELKTNHKIIKIGNSYNDLKIEGVKTLWDIGPQEFLSLIKNAEYVVTNSFHCTAFSINFNKVFYSVLNKNNTRCSRIESLIQLLQLDKHLIYDITSFVFEPIKECKTLSCEEILLQERIKSINFLQNALL